MLAGLSSVGVKVGYGVGASKPASFTKLNRVASIGGLNIENERLDASALEDAITRYINGRADTGGALPLTINITNDTVAEMQAMIDAYDPTGATQMWLQVSAEGLDKAFFLVVQPPQAIPMPEFGQNSVLQVEFGLTVEEYKGLDTKVAF